MKLEILNRQPAARRNTRAKVSCLTCQLKGCVGHCRWETVEPAKPPKNKAA